MESAQYEELTDVLRAAPLVSCLNGTAIAVPGNRLQTFRCKNVCPGSALSGQLEGH